MARERWFFASSHKRQGPMPLAQLVEGLLRLPDPRSSLVWKFGLPAWTPAGDVVEIDRHLAPFVAARKPSPKVVDRAVEAALERRREEEAERLRPRPTERAKSAAGPSPLMYAAGAGGLVVLGVLVWFFWPKAPPPRPKTVGGTSGPGLITLKEGDPAGAGAQGAATGGGSGSIPGQAGFAGWSDQESRLPNLELGKLKGVAGWSDTTLEMTVYNGSAWRITELLVKPHRLVKETFVEDERPMTLLPVGAQVEQGVDQLMNRVAPDRRKAGVNPLDTGKFVGTAGARPEAFRASIVGAKGYPPK